MLKPLLRPTIEGSHETKDGYRSPKDYEPYNEGIWRYHLKDYLAWWDSGISLGQIQDLPALALRPPLAVTVTHGSDD